MKDLKIGIGVPCHVRDRELLFRYCLPSIRRLDPAPHSSLIWINEGHKDGLRGIKTKIYDHLFLDAGVDVVLCVDSDMMLFPGILKFVGRHVIVDFAHIVRAPIASMCKMVIRQLVDKPLCGCLSIPRELWFNKIRDNPDFNGIDSSIIKSVDIQRDFMPLKFPPKFMLMRRSGKQYRKNIMTDPKNLELGVFKRMVYLLGSLHV